MEKEFPKRKTVRLQRYNYDNNGAYFITICTKNRQQILSRVVGTGVLDGPQIELLPHGKIAEKYIKQLNDFYTNVSIEKYVIMPNHIHLILFVYTSENELLDNPGDGPSGTPVPTNQNSVISRFISTFKRFCNKECGTNIWQYRSYDHVIRNQRDYEEHINYIVKNPFCWYQDELYMGE